MPCTLPHLLSNNLFTSNCIHFTYVDFILLEDLRHCFFLFDQNVPASNLGEETKESLMQTYRKAFFDPSFETHDVYVTEVLSPGNQF
jgi:hypothetical protein